MAGTRRSVPVLYADSVQIDSHRARFFIAEKGIAHDIEYEVAGKPSAGLLAANPRGELPTLVDRDLVLHDVRVVIEYLDERHPHPPFMPVDPVSRAKTRLALHRIEADWYALTPERAGGNRGSAANLERIRRLEESLIASADLFRAMPFFLGREFSILDATLAPLLWRLPRYGIVLENSADAVQAYAKRMFSRPAFTASLSDEERGFGLPAQRRSGAAPVRAQRTDPGTLDGPSTGKRNE